MVPIQPMEFIIRSQTVLKKLVFHLFEISGDVAVVLVPLGAETSSFFLFQEQH